jgi:hypothetical protein
MLALFRNPFLRLAGRIWWLPALAVLVLCGLRGEAGLVQAGAIIGAGFLLLAGMGGAAWTHGALMALHERMQRQQERRRFLCPRCLQFGPLDFACSSCGTTVEAFLVHTQGEYVNDCPRCHTRLSLDGRGKGGRVQARCRQCRGMCDHTLYHRRRVRILATLLPDDFYSLRKKMGKVWEVRTGSHSFHLDDGARLTYVLKLDGLPQHLKVLPPGHAARQVEAVWLEGSALESLKLGREVDRLIRQGRLPEAPADPLIVCVAEESLEPTAASLLEARFGTIRCGVQPASFLGLEPQPGENGLRQEGEETGVLPALAGLLRFLSYPLRTWGRRLDREALDRIEKQCARAFPPLFLAATWLLTVLGPAGERFITWITLWVASLVVYVVVGWLSHPLKSIHWITAFMMLILAAAVLSPWTGG